VITGNRSRRERDMEQECTTVLAVELASGICSLRHLEKPYKKYLRAVHPEEK
jgi:hypothetical protein